MDSIRILIPRPAFVASWTRSNSTADTCSSSFWNHDLMSVIPWPAIISLAVLYPVLCSWFRFRRLKAKHNELGFKDRESMAKMTNIQAQSIIKGMSQWEFPLIFQMSLQFALFKTYGIPTISSLLVATRMFSDPENASKRYEDTAVLIGEFVAHSPSEERTRQAIGRMNSLHSPYIQAGKISNQDLLYTLSVFITEPISWINVYEWRQLSDMEICAQGTFWTSIGDAMNITYTGYLKRDSWKDGIEFYEDILEWASQYEAKHMVPAATNKQTANELFELLLYYVPRPLRQFPRQIIGVLMSERLRAAMIYPRPSSIACEVTSGIFSLRRFILRYLTLPRFTPMREFTERDPKSGRYHHINYLVHPYYVKPTFGSRWGLQAWITWALGGVVPGGKGGEKFSPQGYHIAEVGPEKKKPFSKDELKVWETRVEKSRPLGCPFAI